MKVTSKAIHFPNPSIRKPLVSDALILLSTVSIDVLKPEICEGTNEEVKKIKKSSINRRTGTDPTPAKALIADKFHSSKWDNAHMVGESLWIIVYT